MEKVNKILVIDLETRFSLVSKLGKGGKAKEETDYGDCFNPDNAVIIVGCMDFASGAYSSYDLRKPGRLSMLQSTIDNYSALAGHNVKYDYLWLKKIGISMRNHRLYDTMVMEYINLQGQHQKYGLGLDVVAPRYGGVKKMDIVKAFWASGVNTDEIPTSILSKYLAYDVINTRKVLKGLFASESIRQQSDFCSYYTDLLKHVADMEYAGAKFNKGEIRSVEKEIDNSLRDAHAELTDVISELLKKKEDADGQLINLDSPAQLMPIMYSLSLKKERKDDWGHFVKFFRPTRTGAQAKLEGMIDYCFDKLEWGAKIKPNVSWMDDKAFYGPTGFSTGSKVIEALANWGKLNKKQTRLVEAFDGYSKASTWKTSNLAGIINGVKPDGFVHGNFNMAVTVTRRFSSSKPNMQNWPREGTNPLKKLIESQYPGGFIVSPDYKQLEFRVAGLLSGDEVLIADVARGFDIHSHSATMAYGDRFTKADKATQYHLRTLAKRTTFKFQYGAMPKNKIEQAIYDAFYGRYRKLAQWQERIEYTIVRDKSYTCPFTGSIFAFPEARSDNKHQWLTKAKNYPMQYLAAVITGCSIINIGEAFNDTPNRKLILTVHDSNVADCPAEELHDTAMVMKDRMENINPIFSRYFKKTLDILLQVDVSYGSNWYQQETYTYDESIKAA